MRGAFILRSRRVQFPNPRKFDRDCRKRVERSLDLNMVRTVAAMATDCEATYDPARNPSYVRPPAPRLMPTDASGITPIPVCKGMGRSKIVYVDVADAAGHTACVCSY